MTKVWTYAILILTPLLLIVAVVYAYDNVECLNHTYRYPDNTLIIPVKYLKGGFYLCKDVKGHARILTRQELESLERLGTPAEKPHE